MKQRENEEQILARKLGAGITTRVVGRQIECFANLDSTNTHAARSALSGAPEGLVVIARGQTGGRGRWGRRFESAAGKGLYLSALLRPAVAPEAALGMTALAAVAACRAVERSSGARPGIKWTNDLILGGKKLGGILTEATVQNGKIASIVVGVGVNLSQAAADFSPEVAELATSLQMELGEAIDRAALAAALIEELDKAYAALGGDLTAYLRAYRSRCVTLGKRVRVLGGAAEFEAEAVDIGEDFGLVVRKEDGALETVRSGEVSVRGLWGYL